jgi:pseudomonalisin
VFSETGEPVAAAEEVAPGQEVRIAVSLKLRNRAALDRRIERIQAGGAEFVGAGELAASYLPTAAQVERVVQYLNQAGFRNTTVGASRMLVTATGSAANVKAAFNTTLHHFGSGDQRVYANVADAQVPAALADDVLAVHGLQNAYRLHPTYQLADAGTEARPRPVGHSPTDFPLIYDANGLPPASSARLGIISAGDMAQTLVDLATFETSVGFAPVSTTIVHAGAAGSDTSGTIEWDLDSQSSLAAAGGALQEMVFYAGTSFQNADIQAAFDAAVNANHAKVVNVSLGECEIDAMNSGFTASGDQTFALAVSQGQTFSVSTGDAGAKECGRRKGPQGSYPAVSPYVMAIGGTTVITSGTSTFASEKVWRGAGGSPSSTEPAPSWQLASGVLGGSTQRGVPDVSSMPTRAAAPRYSSTAASRRSAARASRHPCSRASGRGSWRRAARRWASPTRRSTSTAAPIRARSTT